jgi:transcription elongation factor
MANIKKLEKNFITLHTPEKTVTIDENLLLYSERLGWIQYIS